MSETNIFERAAEQALRFPSGRGELTVEDLYNLSLTDLDKMAKSTNKALNDEGEGSFLTSSTTTKTSTANRLRLELIVHVIKSREAKALASKNRAEKAAKIAQIKDLVNSKQTEALGSLSVEDLMKELAALEAAVV